MGNGPTRSERWNRRTRFPRKSRSNIRERTSPGASPCRRKKAPTGEKLRTHPCPLQPGCAPHSPRLGSHMIRIVPRMTDSGIIGKAPRHTLTPDTGPSSSGQYRCHPGGALPGNWPGVMGIGANRSFPTRWRPRQRVCHAGKQGYRSGRAHRYRFSGFYQQLFKAASCLQQFLDPAGFIATPGPCEILILRVTVFGGHFAARFGDRPRFLRFLRTLEQLRYFLRGQSDSGKRP